MRRGWVVACLAVVAVVTGIGTNVADDRLLPYGSRAVTGAVGEDVTAFPYVVHVNEARAARSVVESSVWDEGTPIETDGVWVVVNISYATADQVRLPSGSGLVLRDGEGREYPISGRTSTGSAWQAGADIWVRGDLAFEVAPSSLPDLTLVFDPGYQIYGPMPMSYAVIPLDIDPGTIAESITLGEDELLAEGER